MVLPHVNIVSNAYHMESILQVFQQRKLISIILGILGIANFQDDFLLPLPKHDKRLREVFSKIKEKGLKLKKTKCKIRKQSIVLWGHIVLSDVKIDPSKT